MVQVPLTGQFVEVSWVSALWFDNLDVGNLISRPDVGQVLT